jgi:leucyl aminopeptidase
MIEVTPLTGPLHQLEVDALVVGVFDGENGSEDVLAELDRALGGRISGLLTSGELPKGKFETATLYTGGALKAKRLVLVRVGKSAEFSAHGARELAAFAVRYMGRRGASHVGLIVRGIEPVVAAQAVAEGAVLGEYDPAAYKTAEREPLTTSRLCLWLDGDQDLQAAQMALERGRSVAEGVNFTRSLVNEPPNRLSPPALAERAREVAQQVGLEFDVLGPDRMRQEGMGALLAVGQGSEQPPQLIVMRYRGGSGGRIYALVGKGITFDTGGISLKPAEGMDKMKYDMGGGAAVIGAMMAIARLRPPVEVIGLVAAAENMPSGKAYRPGDVLVASNGKTIEITNTDAEGRLVLADALVYATKLGATHIVDAATLTGGCVVALGTITTGVMGSPQEWVDEVLAAARRAGEKAWQLPTFEEYRDLLKSNIADIINSGGREASPIQGAMFLKEFVGSANWAHLDIAGTVWDDKGKPYLPKGPTGVPVRTLVHLVCGL